MRSTTDGGISACTLRNLNIVMSKNTQCIQGLDKKHPTLFFFCPQTKETRDMWLGAHM